MNRAMATRKVSCLTVTDGRLLLLKQAIACYCDQTWPERELVIVTAGGPRYVRAIDRHLSELGRDDIRLVPVDEPRTPLGRLRNIAIDASRGDMLCQWDDDDLSNPRRIELQHRAIAGGAIASCIADHLHFSVEERALRRVSWQCRGARGLSGMAAGTIMAPRSVAARYPEDGPNASIGEDSYFLEALMRHGEVAPVLGCPEVYVYRFHGRNTMSAMHHRRIAGYCAGLEGVPREARAQIEGFELPRPFQIVRADGTVETVAARAKENRAA